MNASSAAARSRKANGSNSCGSGAGGDGAEVEPPAADGDGWECVQGGRPQRAALDERDESAHGRDDDRHLPRHRGQNEERDSGPVSVTT